jgi:sodium/hydrogen antiporter
MTSDLLYLTVGGALLAAVVLPGLLDRVAVSAPMVLVALGFAVGFTPLGEGFPRWLDDGRPVVERLTELTVIVALMGVGLAIDRPLDPRRLRSWRSWASTWRLLGIAMPLSILATAGLGWWAGLAPASALLLGAVLAPTDPVLASDVQVSGPRIGDQAGEEDDDVRFALTSEAGLNDGLAFPFVYAAILAASAGPVASWWGEWVGVYLLGKVAVGTVVGLACGWALARVAFRARSAALRTAERGEPLLVVAATLTAYGLGEVAGGYGFLAVFVCAVAFRSSERGHGYHAEMHQVAERLERLLTLLVLLGLGVALSRGVLEALDWRGVVVGAAVLLLVRPLTARAALVGACRQGSGVTHGERWTIAFFGVRGVGSVYYLAYALGQASFDDTDRLWSTVAFTIMMSVLMHGVLAKPVMRRIDR